MESSSERAERHMIAVARAMKTVEETQQVLQLSLTMTKAALGLSAFTISKVDERREKREQRQRQRDQERFTFDAFDLNDLIQRAHAKNANVQDAEIVND